MLTHRPSEDTLEHLAEEGARPAMSFHDAQRRPLGAPPAAVLGAITIAALVAAMLLAASGAWIGAVIALGVSLGACTLLPAAIRHDPDLPGTHVARRSATRAKSTAWFVAIAARAWTRAAVSLLHIKQRRVRVRRELRQQLAPLGDAVHQGDQARADEIKAHVEVLERKLAESEGHASSAIEQAREIVERERATTQPTRALPRDEIDATGTYKTRPDASAAQRARGHSSPVNRTGRNGRSSTQR